MVDLFYFYVPLGNCHLLIIIEQKNGYEMGGKFE